MQVIGISIRRVHQTKSRIHMDHRVSVVILTYNERLHIERAIAAIRSFAHEIFVVDSFSTDDTVAIATRAGATVVSHDFINHAKQFQWALDNLPIHTPWVMRLDADEVIEELLACEIVEKLPSLPPDVSGIRLKRKQIFLGRWVRHGGRYPLILLRIWRHGLGRIEDRWMDEHIVISSGRIVTFDHAFSDDNLNDLAFFTDKHNKYATREAVDRLNQRWNLFLVDKEIRAGNSSRQAALRRFCKEKIYYRIPFTVSVPAYFVWRYVFQLGFLDGWEGFAYHFLQGFWYRFLVGARILELERALTDCRNNDERICELRRLTGLKLGA